MVYLNVFWNIDISMATINCGQICRRGKSIATRKINQILNSIDNNLLKTCCNA